MVVLEDIRVGNYFILDNKEVIEVQERDFAFIPDLCDLLAPLPINYGRLRKLGFDSFPSINRWMKAAPNGTHIYLKEGPKGKWVIQLENVEKVRLIDYIHELQNFYFWLFSEPLQKPKPKGSEALKPNHSVLKSFFVSRSKNRDGREQKPPVQPYYLSWDCQFLICTSPAIMWQIIDDNPAFEYAGKKWGLKLIQGGATTQNNEMAVTWLKDYLRTVIKE